MGDTNQCLLHVWVNTSVSERGRGGTLVIGRRVRLTISHAWRDLPLERRPKDLEEEEL